MVRMWEQLHPPRSAATRWQAAKPHTSKNAEFKCKLRMDWKATELPDCRLGKDFELQRYKTGRTMNPMLLSPVALERAGES